MIEYDVGIPPVPIVHVIVNVLPEFVGAFTVGAFGGLFTLYVTPEDRDDITPLGVATLYALTLNL